MAKKAAAAKDKAKAGKSRATTRASNAGGAAMAAAPAAPASTAHTCRSYALKMADGNEACRFDLEVVGDDSLGYFLRVSDPSDRPDLVRKALDTLSKFWPKYNWPFKADPNGNITDIG